MAKMPTFDQVPRTGSELFRLGLLPGVRDAYTPGRDGDGISGFATTRTLHAVPLLVVGCSPRRRIGARSMAWEKRASRSLVFSSLGITPVPCCRR